MPHLCKYSLSSRLQMLQYWGLRRLHPNESALPVRRQTKEEPAQ
jgi:hypothetical protein